MLKEKGKKVMKKNEKKYIAPNECSGRRWLGVLAVGLLIGYVMMFPLALLSMNLTGSFLGVNYGLIIEILGFMPMFVGMALAIKFVGKTSMKDFILGAGNSLNKKECLNILLMCLAGFALGNLSDPSHIHLRGVNAGDFAGLVLIMLLLTWMQTTWEELVFRGIILRWFCKNDIGFNKKSILAAVVTSVLFALAHITNPEVTSLQGAERIVMVCVYAIPGMAFFLANLYFGNLMPSIIMHWVNNFFLFTLISGEVSALAAPTLLVAIGSHSAYGMLAGTLLSNLPLAAYILFDILKKKKAAAAA